MSAQLTRFTVLASIIILAVVVKLNWFNEPYRPKSATSTLTQEEARNLAILIASRTGSGYSSVDDTAGSMLPVMDRNCYIVCRDISFDALREGMLVIYQEKEGRRLLHRIYEKKTPQGWSVKGDNNRRTDPEYITPETANRELKEVIAIIYYKRQP